MATIVRKNSTDETFVLLGTGFGAYKVTKPHWFYGESSSEEESDILPVVMVSDADGNVLWLAADDVTVVSVDGSKPGELIGDAG